MFYPGTFLGGEAESPPTPDESSLRVENTPWFQDYVHEVDKELFFIEQIQHVLADRTVTLVLSLSVCLSLCL